MFELLSEVVVWTWMQSSNKQ